MYSEGYHVGGLTSDALSLTFRPLVPVAQLDRALAF